MDILINGNNGDLNAEQYGVVHRADDGTVTWSAVGGPFANKEVMGQVMAHTMCVMLPSGVRHITPGDPDWFYALPLGLHGVLRWTEPTDWPAWEAIAHEKVGYTGKHGS